MSTGREYVVTHRTSYRYVGGEVTSSYGTCHLRPRELPWQQVGDYRLGITPEPELATERLDVFGNWQTLFHVTEPHTALEVTAQSRVRVAPVPLEEAHHTLPWTSARCDNAVLHAEPTPWPAYDFVLASPRVPLIGAAADYARVSLTGDRPLSEALLELTERIYTDFAYVAGATTVTTPIAEVFARRTGVCQDFAQVMIACLRSHGLAASYVSGYLATTPPPGKPRLVGADASHAWVAVWIPAVEGIPGRWWHLDPTNNRACDESHATVAWGRDYGDVAPVRGIIYSQSSGSAMEVSVDMAPVGEGT